MNMNYATIGTSWITQSYIKSAEFTGKWTLYAVYSRNIETAKAFAEKNNAEKYYTDLSELASDKNIDAVYIGSPNALHYEQSKMMLLAGKHVICEKPATVTKDEYAELLELAKKNACIYMEAIMSVHVPPMQLLKDRIGSIGKISAAHIDFCQLSSKYPALLRGELPNIFNPELCTGALMDLCVYNLYLAVSLFGKPQKVISCSSFLETGADYATSAIFVYPDKQISVLCAKTGQGFSASEIIGDLGTIGIDSVSQLTGITFRKKGSDSIEEWMPFDIDRTLIMSYESESFYNYITDGSHCYEYENMHKLALDVREICDEIRKQNNFPF